MHEYYGYSIEGPSSETIFSRVSVKFTDSELHAKKAKQITRIYLLDYP